MATVDMGIIEIFDFTGLQYIHYVLYHTVYHNSEILSGVKKFITGELGKADRCLSYYCTVQY